MGRIQAAAYRLKRALGIPSKELRCSACDRPKDLSRRFICGPGVYMCESCSQALTTRLVNEGTPANQARCSFCSQLRATLAVAELQVCESCVRLLEKILAEDDQNRSRAP